MASRDGKPAQAPHVVIVGGGFGGLYAARSLARCPVRVTLIDRENFHLFQPLLYQVATAALSPGDIAEPIRFILRRQRNARVLLHEVDAVDLANRQLRLGVRVLDYDYLILATGAQSTYFGHEEWETYAPSLKRLPDALEIRRRILYAFEAAEREEDPDVRQAWLTFVIVGGGPTGVELAGAIAEIARHTVRRDFRAIDPTEAKVILLEGAPRVLPPFPEDLSAAAARSLRRLGVEVRTGALVTRVTPEAVYVGDEAIPSRVALWAAAVAASPLGQTLGVPLDRAGHVLVEPDLTVPGHPEVYAIGDLAAFTHQTGRPLPGVAPVAMQQGQTAARNICRTICGQPRHLFRYFDRGSLATIGRAKAVAEIGRFHASGLLAWLAWLFIHIYFLIGFGSRLRVLLQWSWWLFTHERGARLITRPWSPAALLPRPRAPAATSPPAEATPAAAKTAGG
jgi:NADH dehydrogenase